MAKEIKKLREKESDTQKQERKGRAYRNRFIVVLAINVLLLAVIIFQILWWVLH